MKADHATELREAFDRSFAEAAAGVVHVWHEFLRIRLAGAAYAIRLRDIASIHVDIHIEPVPSRSGALLGIAAVRSIIVPVYDLRAIIGVPTSRTARWMVIVSNLARAYSFDGFDGLARTAEQVGDLFTYAGLNHPIVDLARLKER